MHALETSLFMTQNVTGVFLLSTVLQRHCVSLCHHFYFPKYHHHPHFSAPFGEVKNESYGTRQMQMWWIYWKEYKYVLKDGEKHKTETTQASLGIRCNHCSIGWGTVYQKTCYEECVLTILQVTEGRLLDMGQRSLHCRSQTCPQPAKKHLHFLNLTKTI